MTRPGKQLPLFDAAELAEHKHCCKTCGATPPDDCRLFLEPVSQECHDCNHATLAEIIRAGLAGDLAAYEAAWARHYPKGFKRRARLPKRNGGPAPPEPPPTATEQLAAKQVADVNHCHCRADR